MASNARARSPVVLLKNLGIRQLLSARGDKCRREPLYLATSTR